MERTLLLSRLLVYALYVGAPACSGTATNSMKTLTERAETPVSAIIPATFFSRFVKDSIRLDISLPTSYAVDTMKNYHVVYLTDGHWRRSEHDTIHRMSWNKELPEVIVVGIGYPDGYDFDKIRVRDLVMHPDRLLTCIKEEVIPYVETRYRADRSKRTLWGSSYGGHFLMYTFTEHAKAGTLFANYICASAILNPPFEHNDLLHKEKELWETTQELSVSLYLTVGGLEDQSFTSSYGQIVSAIDAHAYTGLRFEHKVIPDKDHMTVWKPTLLQGLRMFLNK